MLSAPQPLTATHVLAGFDSGVPSLDDWLRRRSLQNQGTGASRSFVVCDSGETVVAYYALAASAVAVDRAQHGRGLGRGLFWDAALNNRSSNRPRSCLPNCHAVIHQKKPGYP